MPARWRATCPRTGRARGARRVTARQPDWTQEPVICNEPGRRMVWWGRREAAGTRFRGSCGAGAGSGAALRITRSCVWAGQSKAKPQARSLASTVGFCRSAVPAAQTELSYSRADRRAAGGALRGMAKAQPRRLWARRSRSHSRTSRNWSRGAGAARSRRSRRKRPGMQRKARNGGLSVMGGTG